VLVTWSSEVSRFISTSVDESRVLEFKREIALHDRTAKIETLKDLTGMANGGGGLVVFGIDEVTHIDGRVTSGGALPIGDRSIPGQLMDIIRDTVFPPLLVELHEVDIESGYVLVAELFASPLGPYMVEGFGQHRFFSRSGRSTVPMSEQQVRDRYALALRAREHRQEVWAAHGMPMKQAHGPWLGVSMVPEEPLIRRMATGR
jgi:predicted HTH transcriptional regulator